MGNTWQFAEEKLSDCCPGLDDGGQDRSEVPPVAAQRVIGGDLDEHDRDTAYGELARVLQPGGHALIGFHVRDADHEPGEAITHREWWARPVELIFRFLDPDTEIGALSRAGFHLVARVYRAPYPGSEYPSERCYLLARKPSL